MDQEIGPKKYYARRGFVRDNAATSTHSRQFIQMPENDHFRFGDTRELSRGGSNRNAVYGHSAASPLFRHLNDSVRSTYATKEVTRFRFL
jgi:hypothetical protein